MRPDLPTGTVTFLFTDVEGSTRLLHELGAEAYAEALAEHRRVIRGACASHGGVEVDTQGDAFFFAFPTAPGALAAASAFTAALSTGPIRVRVGVHTGTPLLTDEGYVGSDVHRAARIAAAGHGGQVLVAASTAALVDVELRDLGEHRFKDLADPERVFQLESRDFAPLKSLFRTNLPVPANPLVGREQELDDVLGLLTGDGSRIVTLTGPGGVGKTRFSVAVAAEAAASFPDGVWFVPLANLRSPDLVLPTIASVLGVDGDLARHIGEDACLLVLDNLEQVIDASGEIATLVSSCPRLRLLITSREALRVGAEREYPIAPLSTSSSVELFRQRATGAVPGSEVDVGTAAAICDRLDGLPLAIELAAVRTKALTPTQLLDRLSARLDLLKGGRDADPRHATLRATIEWSFDLLSAKEQGLFERLGVFVGGCTLEAAETVCDADIDELQSLVEKSLVRFSRERYWMLETIYAFASERLAGVRRVGRAAAPARGVGRGLRGTRRTGARPGQPRPVARPAGRRARQPSSGPALGHGRPGRRAGAAAGGPERHVLVGARSHDGRAAVARRGARDPRRDAADAPRASARGGRAPRPSTRRSRDGPAARRRERPARPTLGRHEPACTNAPDPGARRRQRR